MEDQVEDIALWDTYNILLFISCTFRQYIIRECFCMLYTVYMRARVVRLSKCVSTSSARICDCQRFTDQCEISHTVNRKRSVSPLVMKMNVVMLMICGSCSALHSRLYLSSFPIFQELRTRWPHTRVTTAVWLSRRWVNVL